jgi:hypothetical protein
MGAQRPERCVAHGHLVMTHRARAQERASDSLGYILDIPSIATLAAPREVR